MSGAVLQSSRAVGRHNDSLFLLASVDMFYGGGGAVDGEKRKITVMNRTKVTQQQGKTEKKQNEKVNISKMKKRVCEGGS